MDNELSRILKIIDTAPERFNAKIPDIEKKVFREISLLLKDLKTLPNGRIASSVENLNLISSIKGKLGKILVSKEYAELVKKFVGNFPAVANFQSATAGLAEETKKTISAVARQNIDNTLESLIGAGYRQEVVSKLYNTLLTNVTAGGSYADMTEQLRNQLVSTEKRPGVLSKYARTYVTDAIGQFAGQGNKMIADRLNSEWFQYVGSNLTTTREFCLHLTKKRYVHKSEIPEILKGHIDGHECEIYEKTGLPKGMIEGTNEENFVVYRGGHNCGHELIPVSEVAVPKHLRDRILKTPVKEFRQWTKNNLQGQSFKPSNFDREIKFTGSGIKEYLNQPHKHFYQKNLFIKDIQNVIEHSTYRGVTNYKGRTSHIFETEISGDKSWIIVNEIKGMGNLFYSISESEKVLTGIKK